MIVEEVELAAARVSEEQIRVQLDDGGASLIEVLGPAAIVIAALVGAWFAARYARKNIAQELAAAEQRLETQMAHDRELREREATRATLDEVVATMTEILSTAADLAAAISTAEGLRNELDAAEAESAVQKDRKERLEAFEGETVNPNQKNFIEALLNAHPAKLRLRLRYQTDHPVIATFGKWQDTMDRSYDHVIKGLNRVRSEQEMEETNAVHKEIPVALEEFVSAVRTWADATPTPAGTSG